MPSHLARSKPNPCKVFLRVLTLITHNARYKFHCFYFFDSRIFRYVFHSLPFINSQFLFFLPCAWFNTHAENAYIGTNIFISYLTCPISVSIVISMFMYSESSVSKPEHSNLNTEEKKNKP